MPERDAERQSDASEERPASVIGRTLQYGGIGIIVLLAVFLLQNLQEARVNFLWFEWTVRMVWALLVSAVFGAVGSVLTYLLVARRRRPERGN
ncbi:MAG: LapA family protein [Dehalococcoidia bacterium]